jgi:hypothetical protein
MNGFDPPALTPPAELSEDVAQGVPAVPVPLVPGRDGARRIVILDIVALQRSA